MNANLDLLALLGLGISSFILITGCANMLLMAACGASTCPWSMWAMSGTLSVRGSARHLDCRAEIQKTQSSFGSALPAFRAAMRL
ncbi:LMF1 isoform 2 [Pongo abelii]|uniref:LMF1 isoform 2 n=1 Tax=Pongo abelii TaxID=9601 RepID=A0A2J8QZE4_PONAB|nr:LMF1 isoform 2 [Pongo abelii]